MSMDKSAIQQIQQSNTAVALNEDLTKSLNVETYAIALPDDFSLRSLELFMPTRQRFKGVLSTRSLDAFTNYVDKNAISENYSTVFIDDLSMRAQCIFDLGNNDHALHCQHSATLTLPKTAPYEALLNFAGRQWDQTQFSEFLEDWRHNITCLDAADNNISVIAAIARIRKITIDSARSMESEVQNFSNSASAMEKVEARNAETLPAVIKFNCQPYAELEDREFELRISLKTGGQQPTLIARIIGFEAIKEELANEFKIELDRNLAASEVETYIGNFSD